MWKYPSLLFSTWSKKNGEKQIQELVDAASVREQPVPWVHSCTSVQVDKSARVQVHNCTSVQVYKYTSIQIYMYTSRSFGDTGGMLRLSSVAVGWGGVASGGDAGKYTV